MGERHVVVARGRDDGDVPPLKCICHGLPDSDMRVTVEVTASIHAAVSRATP